LTTKTSHKFSRLRLEFGHPHFVRSTPPRRFIIKSERTNRFHRDDHNDHRKTSLLPPTPPTTTMEELLKAVSANGTSVMPLVAPHLSRHLLFPLIQFEGDNAAEKGDDELAKQILSGKIKLLEDTNMTDYVATLYCELHGTADPPAEYTKKRQEVLAQLEMYEQATAKIADLLTQDEVVNGLRSDKVANLEFLKNQHGVSNLVIVLMPCCCTDACTLPR
jgi:hypothetical protein